MFQTAPLFSFKIQTIGLCQLIICMTLFQHQQNIKPSYYFLQTPKLKPDCLGIHFSHALKMSRTSQITIWSLSKVEEKTLKFDWSMCIETCILSIKQFTFSINFSNYVRKVFGLNIFRTRQRQQQKLIILLLNFFVYCFSFFFSVMYFHIIFHFYLDLF